jgi:enoyl-CoA hydratase/carnithine racemase
MALQTYLFREIESGLSYPGQRRAGGHSKRRHHGAAGGAAGDQALGAAKRLVWSGLGARVEAQLPEEARTVSELSGTADAREGLAAVIERRPPVFGGR